MRRSLTAGASILTVALVGLGSPLVAHADSHDHMGQWYTLTWTSTPTLYAVSQDDGSVTPIGTAPESIGVAGLDIDATNGLGYFPTYTTTPGALWTVDLTTGAFNKVADSNFSAATAFDIGNNGELWLAADNLDGGGRGFGVLDPVTGQATRLGDGPGRIAALSTSPEGVLYAFTYGGEVYTYDADANSFTFLAEITSVDILAADFDTDGSVLLQAWDGTLSRYDIGTGATSTVFKMGDASVYGEAFAVGGPTDGRTLDEVLNPPAPAPAPAVALSAVEAPVDGEVTVTGTGFTPSGSVTVELHSTPVTVGTTTAAADGTFSLTFAIPAGTAPGAHTVVAIDNATGRTATFALTVYALQPAAAAPQLPATGPVGTEAVLGAAAGFVLLGLMAIAIRRRLSREVTSR